MSKEASKEFIKKLIDAPFGGAEKLLRDKGLWDESRIPKSERTVKEYEVDLEGAQPSNHWIMEFREQITIGIVFFVFAYFAGLGFWQIVAVWQGLGAFSWLPRGAKHRWSY